MRDIKDKKKLSIDRTNIDWLFDELSKIYGYAWGHQWKGQVIYEVKNTWHEGLKDLDKNYLAFGVEKCKVNKNGYAPNLPTFRNYCLPTNKMLGIPIPEDAYRDATKGLITHPMILEVARNVGWFDLKNFTREQVYPRFLNKYQECLERAQRGELFHYDDLNPNVKKIAAITDKNNAKKHLSNILDLLKGKIKCQV